VTPVSATSATATITLASTLILPFLIIGTPLRGKSEKVKLGLAQNGQPAQRMRFFASFYASPVLPPCIAKIAQKHVSIAQEAATGLRNLLDGSEAPPGGVRVAFCDGSVHFLSARVDLSKWH
jgi:hypothetical protein